MTLCLLFCLGALAKDNSKPPERLTVFADTAVYRDNYRAAELIRKYCQDTLAAHIKQSMLIEQIASSGDNAQHKLLEERLNNLRISDSAKLAASRAEIDSVKSRAAPASVILRGDTLLTLYVPTGSLAPNERAALYSGRILQAAKQAVRTFPASTRGSLAVVDNGVSADIVIGETVLVNITDMDAHWVNSSRSALARLKAENIGSAFAAYEKTLGMWNIIGMAGLTLLAAALLFVLFKLVSHLFCKVIDRKIAEKRDTLLINGLRFRNVELLTSAKLVSAALFISKTIRFAIYAFLLYTALPMIFAIFPSTRHLAAMLFSWIITPLVSIGENFAAYLPRLLRIIIILVVMRYILKFLRYIALEIEAGRLAIPGFYPDWAHATYNLLRIFLCAFTIVLIFPLLPESESAVFKGVSVFIGILFSIGSTSVVANMMAGLVITYMRSFKIGDRIKIGEVFGDVVEKTPFVIRVQTVKKEIITIPNSTILSSNVVNYSAGVSASGVILYQNIYVGYDVTWERAGRLLMEAALKTEHILNDPKPFVLTQNLGDNAVSYQINAYTKRPDLQTQIYSEMNRNILDIFQRDGIEMITPQYKAIRSGERSTIAQRYAQTEEQPV
jgi:small-conductance mechanosensitive channel